MSVHPLPTPSPSTPLPLPLTGELHLWSHQEGSSSGQGLGATTGLGTTMRSGQHWRKARTYPVGAGEINSVALLGSCLAAGCQDGSVRLFRMQRDAGAWMLYSLLRLQHTSAGGRSGAAPAAAPGPAQQRSAAEGRGAEAAASVASPGEHEVMCVGLSAVSGARNTQLLASGAQDGTVRVWRLNPHPHPSP